MKFTFTSNSSWAAIFSKALPTKSFSTQSLLILGHLCGQNGSSWRHQCSRWTTAIGKRIKTHQDRLKLISAVLVSWPSRVHSGRHPQKGLWGDLDSSLLSTGHKRFEIAEFNHRMIQNVLHKRTAPVHPWLKAVDTMACYSFAWSTAGLKTMSKRKHILSKAETTLQLLN